MNAWRTLSSTDMDIRWFKKLYLAIAVRLDGGMSSSANSDASLRKRNESSDLFVVCILSKMA
jgi:hypothetical protein